MMGLLNFSLLWYVNVRGEIDVSSRGEWLKKSVQQGRELLARSRWGSPLFDARSVLSVHEHGKRATCLRIAASAKARNAAGGFFQHSHVDTEQRIIGNIGCLGLEEWKSISQIFPL
jgi:hypothetical protein